MHEPTPADTIREPEASRYIGLSVPWLRRARMGGYGPAYFRIGRAIRYRVEDLDAWLSTRRVETRESRAAATTEAA